jgi:hypothetical protein
MKNVGERLLRQKLFVVKTFQRFNDVSADRFLLFDAQISFVQLSTLQTGLVATSSNFFLRH